MLPPPFMTLGSEDSTLDKEAEEIVFQSNSLQQYFLHERAHSFLE